MPGNHFPGPVNSFVHAIPCLSLRISTLGALHTQHIDRATVRSNCTCTRTVGLVQHNTYLVPHQQTRQHSQIFSKPPQCFPSLGRVLTEEAFRNAGRPMCLSTWRLVEVRLPCGKTAISTSTTSQPSPLLWFAWQAAANFGWSQYPRR